MRRLPIPDWILMPITIIAVTASIVWMAMDWLLRIVS